MWPDGLNEDEQKAVTDFDRDLRGFAAELSALRVRGSAIAAAWAGGIATMVAELSPETVVPNTSSLSGSQPMNRADIANLAGYATQISDDNNPSQGEGAYASDFIHALCVKACGINASIGG